VDDVKNMDESIDTIEQSPGSARGIDRRAMLKAAVAAGTIAGTWVAPRIETLGFAPAGAATMCVIESNEQQDKNNNNSGNTYCSDNTIADVTCCDSGSFGNAGQIERWTFLAPTANCTQLVVRTIPTDCNTGGANAQNPNIGQFAVVVDNSAGQTTGAGCSNCFVSRAYTYEPGDKTNILVEHATPFSAACGTGVLVQNPVTPLDYCDLPNNSARLGVTITCTTTGACQ
jgi:hypothetical protein